MTDDLPELDDRCHTCGTDGQLADIQGVLYCSDCFMRSMIGVTFEEAVASVIGDQAQQEQAELIAVGKQADQELVTNEARLEFAQQLSIMSEVIDTAIPSIQAMLKAGVSPAAILIVVLALRTPEEAAATGFLYTALIELAQRGWLKENKDD